MKTFIDILQDGIEGYEFRMVLDNLSDEEILTDVEKYVNQYRNLLTKYIEHVKSCEGVDYINNGETHSEIMFTQSELELLKLLAGNQTF
jgi:hypothetical protein